MARRILLSLAVAVAGTACASTPSAPAASPTASVAGPLLDTDFSDEPSDYGADDVDCPGGRECPPVPEDLLPILHPSPSD